MKKLFLFVLAILLTFGVANATNIPVLVDPKNEPVVWTELVYNGSGSEIVSGFIVQWDFDTANVDEGYNDDRCPWVKLNATDEGVWQAGIVPYGKNIANGDVGAIVIKGAVYGRVGSAIVADNLVASDTSGTLSAFDGGANDECALGVAIKISSFSTGAPDDGAAGAGAWGIVFVDPMRFDEN